jgi:hypothetical protein
MCSEINLGSEYFGKEDTGLHISAPCYWVLNYRSKGHTDKISKKVNYSRKNVVLFIVLNFDTEAVTSVQ